MFVVADKVGGQVMGAFDGNSWWGSRCRFRARATGTSICTRTCWRCGRDHRNGGLGRRLKLMQREDALARGIELIEWTFDPLEIKNAYLNIEKLGAIARRYNINQYGITSSPLQGGLPTDRLIAEWWLKSKRVEAVAGGREECRGAESRRRYQFPRRSMSGRRPPETRQQALASAGAQSRAVSEGLCEWAGGAGIQRDAEGNGKYLLGQLG